MEALKDAGPEATVLALQALFRIESEVKSGQFPEDVRDKVRDILQKWRCESPLRGAYSGACNRIPDFLRSLTIFETLEVPLFIDGYGKKELLNKYTGSKDIHINEETAIFHVTHSQEAEMIVKEKQLKASDNKNIIKELGSDLKIRPASMVAKAFKQRWVS